MFDMTEQTFEVPSQLWDTRAGERERVRVQVQVRARVKDGG
jgi:hypothetical protein